MELDQPFDGLIVHPVLLVEWRDQGYEATFEHNNSSPK
jgi:hypothetical protein